MPRPPSAWPLPLSLLLLLAACGREAGEPGAPVPASPTPAPPVTSIAPSAPAPPSTAPSPAVEPTPLARYDGYGDLRFGMREAEATQAWGGDLKPLPAATEPCHYLAPDWVRVPADFALMIEDGRFVRYDVGTDREIAPGGGRVGMAAAEIGRRYPGAVRGRHKYVEGGAVLRVADPAGGRGVLVFEADAAGKVTSWRAGVPPQVDYVEGCA